MLRFFITAAFLVISSSLALKVQLDSDANIYEAAKNALAELKLRQLAEEDGTNQSPNIIQRASSVCYDELGCFDKNGTFKHLKQLPEPPETVNTKFLLYTRKNLLKPQILDYKDPETILNSNINPNAPIKFISHGFGGKNNLTWMWEMKTAFLEKEDLNVIAIDWSLGARVPYYIQATVNTELVGAEAAVLYYLIKDKLGIMEKDLHVIGFSLGAHVAGFVGKRMQELRGTRPGRITGLDPASPLFEDYGGEVHLYKDDADYVDVIHTNADYFIYGGVGIEKPIGHVDYFPNGGKRQPGCGSTIAGLLKDLFNKERDRTCNHERAVHLFTESILDYSPCEFTGYKCTNYIDFQLGICSSCAEQCGRMGYRSHGSGVYYLMTDEKSPFCAGTAKLEVKFPSKIKKSYGAIVLTFVSKSGNKENVTITANKDEKLSPGGEKVKLLLITDVIKDIDFIQALYIRYSGLITSGKETFGLASVTLKDFEGQFLWKSCNDNIVLKDNQYQILKQTDATC